MRLWENLGSAQLNEEWLITTINPFDKDFYSAPTALWMGWSLLSPRTFCIVHPLFLETGSVLLSVSSFSVDLSTCLRHNCTYFPSFHYPPLERNIVWFCGKTSFIILISSVIMYIGLKCPVLLRENNTKLNTVLPFRMWHTQSCFSDND